MKIIPSMDLLNGQVVRLYQGDFQQVTQYYDDPIKAVESLVNDGAQRLHIVDLNGADGARINNRAIIEAIIQRFEIDIQIGGGIRTFEEAEAWLTLPGVRVVVGTMIFESPSDFARLTQKYPNRIIAALDIKDQTIRTKGWRVDTGITIEQLLEAAVLKGVYAILVTDISLDGSLTGPNFEKMAQLKRFSDMKWIASGGVRTLGDLMALKALGLYGAIVGKAYYEGKIKQLEDLC